MTHVTITSANDATLFRVEAMFRSNMDATDFVEEFPEWLHPISVHRIDAHTEAEIRHTLATRELLPGMTRETETRDMGMPA